MAKFELAVQPGKKRYASIEAGFQDWGYDWDAGQWTGCKVGKGNPAGTNMSISSCLLSGVRGYDVTKQEMQDLTKEEALSIYKTKFWDKIGGDKLKSQRITEFLFNMGSSAGGNAYKTMQRALNKLGENLSVDGAIGQLSQAAINRQVEKGKEAELYNTFRSEMLAYYKRLNEPSGFYEKRVKSMDKWFPPMESNEVKSKMSWVGYAFIGLAVIALSIGSYWLYSKTRK